MSPDLLSAILINLLPIVIALAVALYKIGMQYLPANKQEQLKSLVGNLSGVAQTVVNAIEQSMPGADGAAKKAAAANTIEAFLNAAGVKVDPALVSAAIEAAVFTENQYLLPRSAVQPAPAPVVVPGQDAEPVAPVAATAK